MSEAHGAEDRERIAAILTALNDAWRLGDPDRMAADIAPLFSPSALIVAPNLERQAGGREAIAASYADFARSVVVVDVSLDPPEIDIIGDVGVATLRWAMRYRVDGNELDDKGHDVYVFGRRGDGWEIVWRSVTVERP